MDKAPGVKGRGEEVRNRGRPALAFVVRYAVTWLLDAAGTIGEAKW